VLASNDTPTTTPTTPPTTTRRRTLLVASVLVVIGVTGFVVGHRLAPSPPVLGGPDPGATTSGIGHGSVDVSGGLDAFDRPDRADDLGRLAGGTRWRAVTGVWGVQDEQAHVTAPVEGRNMAIVGLGQGDGAVQVKVARMGQGAGVVFRYRDPTNYWYVAAAPGYASWAAVKVVDGHEQGMGTTGTSPVGDGTTVAVRFGGDTIDIALDGVVRTTINDGTLADAAGVGMAVSGPAAADVRFDDFRAALADGQAPPAGT